MIRLDEVSSAQSLISVYEACGYTIDDVLKKIEEIEQKRGGIDVLGEWWVGHFMGGFIVDVPSEYKTTLINYKQDNKLSYVKLSEMMNIKTETLKSYLRRKNNRLREDVAKSIERFLKEKGLIEIGGSVEKNR